MAFDGGPLRKAMALSWHCVYTLPKKEIMLTQATKLNTRLCDWFLLLSHMFSIFTVPEPLCFRHFGRAIEKSLLDALASGRPHRAAAAPNIVSDASATARRVA